MIEDIQKSLKDLLDEEKLKTRKEKIEFVNENVPEEQRNNNAKNNGNQKNSKEERKFGFKFKFNGSRIRKVLPFPGKLSTSTFP